MVSVIQCLKAEYQKCKHSILLYMHSLIPNDEGYYRRRVRTISYGLL